MSRSFEADFSALVSEYVGVTSSTANDPVDMIYFCDRINEGVSAIDAISRSIGDKDVDPNGLSAAIGIVTVKLDFELKAMRMLLLNKDGRY